MIGLIGHIGPMDLNPRSFRSALGIFQTLPRYSNQAGNKGGN